MVIFLLIFTALNANATLGEPESSVTQVETKFKATNLKTQRQSNYTVRESTSDGITIKEYVSLEGKVFAVRWQGLSHPDLQTLFGSYYTEFSKAEKIRPRKRNRRSVSTNTSKLVVIRSGRMMDVHGLAYVPELVPAGINPKRLK